MAGFALITNRIVGVATHVGREGTASYQINQNWASMVRLSVVGNDAPGEASDGRSFANPLIGATYAGTLGGYRLALFGAATLPVGTGGGDAPNIRAAKTNAASRTARPADDAMFAVNYTTAIAGADFAYVDHGLTAQAEATMLQFVRVRGETGIGATDVFRTEAVVGLHIGYFIGSHFSLSGDLHHRRWLSHATTLDAATGARVALSDADMASTTVAVGPRFHFRVGTQGSVRPGISFVRGLDARGFHAPLLTAQATGVQIDVPVTMAGHDAVFSTLAPRGREVFSAPSKRAWTMAGYAANIVRAMQQAGVKRLLAFSSAGLSPGQSLFVRMLSFPARHHIADLKAMEEVYEASSLDWTLLRPTWMKAGTSEANRVAPGALPEGSKAMHFRGLAKFMLDAAAEGSHRGELLGIGR